MNLTREEFYAREMMALLATGLVPDEAGVGTMTTWQDIGTAPRDGSRFWGKVGDDAIAMLWHEGFGEFVSSWRRMEMAPGYTIDDQPYKDHSPVVHHPEAWMPLPTGGE